MELYGNKTFTVWYGVYQQATCTLIYSGGGHPDALLYAPTGNGAWRAVERLASEGPVIGIMPWPEFENRTCEVAVGSRLYIYSDGVHEILLGDATVRRYEDFLSDVSRFVAAGGQVMDRLIKDAIRFRGSPSLDDDLTIVELIF